MGKSKELKEFEKLLSNKEKVTVDTLEELSNGKGDDEDE